jgi:hypothetical protein
MMIFQEKIPPPLAVLADKEQKLATESLASDDRWIKNIIDGLTGILREKQ